MRVSKLNDKKKLDKEEIEEEVYEVTEKLNQCKEIINNKKNKKDGH